MIGALEAIAVFALAATGVAGLIRSLPFWPQTWKARKPLSCAFCMGGWCSMAVMAVAWREGLWACDALSIAALIWAASTGLAAFLLAQSGIFASDLFAHEP